MKEPNYVAGEKLTDFTTAVQAVVNRSCIVDYGIIQDVPADGIVDVSLAVSKTPQDVTYMTCVLANIASSAFTLNIKPKKGDRVLVLYPRVYDEGMFSIKNDDSDTEIIENKQAKGYNLLSGIAILCNQYKDGKHKNIITIDDGALDVKLCNDKVKFSTNTDGEISIASNETKVEIDKNGNVTINAKGKISLKNQMGKSLFSILNSILTKLNTTLQTQGSPALHVVVPQQFVSEQQDLTALMR